MLPFRWIFMNNSEFNDRHIPFFYEAFGILRQLFWFNFEFTALFIQQERRRECDGAFECLELFVLIGSMARCIGTWLKLIRFEFIWFDLDFWTMFMATTTNQTQANQQGTAQWANNCNSPSKNFSICRFPCQLLKIYAKQIDSIINKQLFSSVEAFHIQLVLIHVCFECVFISFAASK